METIGPFRSEGTFRDWEMDAVVYFKFIHLVRMQGVKTDRQTAYNGNKRGMENL